MSVQIEEIKSVVFQVDTVKAAKEALLRMHPILEKLVKNKLLNKHCFIAGGALVEAFIQGGSLKRVTSKPQDYDIDIFCCFPCDKFVTKLMKMLIHFQPQAYIKNDGIITILTKNYRNIQVTYCYQQDSDVILKNFDLGCCQVMFDGESIKGTEHFNAILKTGWMEDISRKTLPQDRVQKYINRGVKFVGGYTPKKDLNQKYIGWNDDYSETYKAFKAYDSSYKPLTFPLALPEHNWLDSYTGESDESVKWKRTLRCVDDCSLKIVKIQPDNVERIMITTSIKFEGTTSIKFEGCPLVKNHNAKHILIERTTSIMERFKIDNATSLILKPTDHIILTKSCLEDLERQCSRGWIVCTLVLEQKISEIPNEIYFSTKCIGAKYLFNDYNDSSDEESS